MRLLRLFGLFALIVLPFQSSADAKGWALLVGINDYENSLIRDLRGCEMDVQLVKDVLKDRFGFTDGDVKILLSRQATRDNIIKAFREWLIEKPQPGDAVVFYFSGHGAQVIDEDGDEVDGWDELLCPADLKPTSDRSQYANPLLDDQLNDLLNQIPTDNVTVILDSCHSGTGTKSLVSAELSYPKAIPRDLILVPQKPPARPVTQRETVSVEQVNENHVLISGSAAEEVSIDAMWHSPVGEVYYAGVLTKNLVEALRHATEETSYVDLMESVRRNVRARSRQTPQLEGNARRPVFSVRNPEGDYSPFVAVPAKPFFHITRVDRETATINAGSILGVTKGSIYGVFSPTEASFAGDPLARLQITSVDLHEASGQLFESRFTIQPLCRVVASSYAHQTDKLALRLQFEGDRMELERLQQALSKLPDATLAQPGQYADLVFEVEKKGTGFHGAMTSSDGTVLHRATAPDVEKLVEDFKPSVENAVIKKWLASLKNPNPPFKIRVWTDKGDNPVYRVGDAATFEFTSEQDCYLTLLNVDTGGAITMLFPNRFHPDNKIIANKVYTIPSEDMKFRIRAQGPPGRELLKAIATTEPIRLPGLDVSKLNNTQEAFLDVGGSKEVRSITTALGRAFVVERKEEPKPEDPQASTIITHLPTSKFVTSEFFAEVQE
jgi:hypothetical protein